MNVTGSVTWTAIGVAYRFCLLEGRGGYTVLGYQTCEYEEPNKDKRHAQLELR